MNGMATRPHRGLCGLQADDAADGGCDLDAGAQTPTSRAVVVQSLHVGLVRGSSNIVLRGLTVAELAARPFVVLDSQD